MKIKTADTLVTFPRAENVVVYNYLTKAAIICEAADLLWLSVAAEWIDTEKIIESYPDIEPNSLREKLQSLVDTGIILAEDTEGVELETNYAANWELGKAAAILHFTLNDCEFATLEDSALRQKVRALTDPSPPLFRLNNGYSIALTKRPACASGSLLGIMARRRSVRQVLPEAIKVNDLADCLYAGLGITGFVQTETSVLPLKQRSAASSTTC